MVRPRKLGFPRRPNTELIDTPVPNAIVGGIIVEQNRDKKEQRRKERMIKTSDSHPIRIDAIEAGAGRGRIDATFPPRKHDSAAAGGYWERDLAKDLDAIANWKANAVVALIEPNEMDLLGIPNLGEELRRRGMDWLHLPFRDVSTPSARSRRIGPCIAGDCETCSTTVRTFSSTAAAVSPAPA
jgi:hypothetical protein